MRGRLAEVTLAGPTLHVVDPRWRRAGEAAGGLGAAVLLALLGAQARRMMTWRMARRRGLAAIRAAYDADTLAHAVRAFSLAGAAPAPSLGAWQARLRAETGVDAAEVVRLLERYCYSRAAYPLKDVQGAFLKALAALHPR